MEVPMEEKSLDGNGNGNGNSSSSRWNPTKEQITMLESLYKQGIKTPSAEQIQQITGRLKAYGHIEGKNVFYWFQNHKARQRQKQKQESMVYFNPFFHNPTLVSTPTAPSNNVVCSTPYYIPQTGMGYYPQYPKLPLPSNVVKRRSRVEKSNNVIGGGAGHQHDYHPYMNNVNDQSTKGTPNSGETETLPLFPLHPTGILEHERSGGICSSMENSNTSNTTSDQSGGGGDIKECSANQPFFDFFAHHHGSE